MHDKERAVILRTISYIHAACILICIMIQQVTTDCPTLDSSEA